MVNFAGAEREPLRVISPSSSHQNRRSASSPSPSVPQIRPILFATKSNNFLHFHRPQKPHLRFAKVPQDTDATFHFLLLQYNPGKQPSCIDKPRDGQNVLLCLASPRWFVGFKADGSLFLLSSPTSLTLWTVTYPKTESPYFKLVHSTGRYLTFNDGTLCLADDSAGDEKLFRFYFVKPEALARMKEIGNSKGKDAVDPATPVTKGNIRILHEGSEISVRHKRSNSHQLSKGKESGARLSRASIHPVGSVPLKSILKNSSYPPHHSSYTAVPVVRPPVPPNNLSVGHHSPPPPRSQQRIQTQSRHENSDHRKIHPGQAQKQERLGTVTSNQNPPVPRSYSSLRYSQSSTYRPHQPAFPASQLPPSEIPSQSQHLKELKDMKNFEIKKDPSSGLITTLSIPIAIRDIKDRALARASGSFLNRNRVFQFIKHDPQKFDGSIVYFHVHYVNYSEQEENVVLKEFIDLNMNKANGQHVVFKNSDSSTYLCVYGNGDIGEQTDLTKNAVWSFRKLPYSPLAFGLTSVHTGAFLSVDSNIPRASAAKIGVNQSFNFFIPPTLQQAVALQGRPPMPGKMGAVTAAITGASLMGASAAIVQMVLNIQRQSTLDSSHGNSTSGNLTNGTNQHSPSTQIPSNDHGPINSDPNTANIPSGQADPNVSFPQGIPELNPNGTPVLPEAGHFPPPPMPTGPDGSAGPNVPGTVDGTIQNQNPLQTPTNTGELGNPGSNPIENQPVPQDPNQVPGDHSQITNPSTDSTANGQPTLTDPTPLAQPDSGMPTDPTSSASLIDSATQFQPTDHNSNPIDFSAFDVDGFTMFLDTSFSFDSHFNLADSHSHGLGVGLDVGIGDGGLGFLNLLPDHHHDASGIVDPVSMGIVDW